MPSKAHSPGESEEYPAYEPRKEDEEEIMEFEAEEDVEWQNGHTPKVTPKRRTWLTAKVAKVEGLTKRLEDRRKARMTRLEEKTAKAQQDLSRELLVAEERQEVAEKQEELKGLKKETMKLKYPGAFKAKELLGSTAAKGAKGLAGIIKGKDLTPEEKVAKRAAAKDRLRNMISSVGGTGQQRQPMILMGGQKEQKTSQAKGMSGFSSMSTGMGGMSLTGESGKSMLDLDSGSKKGGLSLGNLVGSGGGLLSGGSGLGNLVSEPRKTTKRKGGKKGRRKTKAKVPVSFLQGANLI